VELTCSQQDKSNHPDRTLALKQLSILSSQFVEPIQMSGNTAHSNVVHTIRSELLDVSGHVALADPLAHGDNFSSIKPLADGPCKSLAKGHSPSRHWSPEAVITKPNDVYAQTFKLTANRPIRSGFRLR
jgi:hypothetical protein